MSVINTEMEAWEKYRQQMEAMGLDPREPHVGEDSPHFEKVQAILAQFGGVAPLPPLPPQWKGDRPVDYDGTLEGVGKWLDSEIRTIHGDKAFCGGENTGLLQLNEVIGNAHRVLQHLGIEDPPKRLPRATAIEDAVKRIENLAAFVDGKIKEGWQSAKQDQLVAVSTDANPLYITRWGDLGIGIHEKMYYAFTQCPRRGERVALRTAHLLELPGEQWRALLDCLARSSDGKTVEKSELAQEFGYFKKGDVDSKKAAYDELSVKAALHRVTPAMANLAKKLRQLVSCEDKTVVFKAVGDNYEAVFLTQYLLRDEERQYRFGKAK